MRSVGCLEKWQYIIVFNNEYFFLYNFHLQKCDKAVYSPFIIHINKGPETVTLPTFPYINYALFGSS